VSVFALIPARGGSKGIPRKNLVPLGGRPLIAHTVLTAQAAAVDEVFLSTDDEAIAEVCRDLGVNTPYRRPLDLAGDETKMIDVVLHWMDWARDEGPGEPDVLVLLQPTSPLRAPADINGTLESMRRHGAHSAVSVHAMAEHPMECVTVASNGWSFLLEDPNMAGRRQDYAGRHFFINGAVYATTTEFLRKRRAFMTDGNETAIYEMDPLRGIDIDTEADLLQAEAYVGHPGIRSRLADAGVVGLSAAT